VCSVWCFFGLFGVCVCDVEFCLCVCSVMFV